MVELGACAWIALSSEAVEYASSGTENEWKLPSSLMWGSGVEMKDDWGAISGFMTMDY